MGTRGITAVIINGERKVSQYGQWDHYPDGQGLTALDILTQEGVQPALRKHAAALTTYTEEAWQARMTEILGRDLDGFVHGNEDDKINTQGPELSRDTGAKILLLVAGGTVKNVVLTDPPDADDIWIEGQYTVDFDRNLFISVYGKQTVEFPLDALPEPDVYLAAFGQ